MFGLVNINKPLGKTSREAVNHVQRLVRPVKVGHAGTLDPMAGGVLVMCLGPATRLIQYVQQLPKQYTGTFLLGQRSDSDDLECEVVAIENAVVPTAEEVTAALPRFTGTISQRPPIYSAVKVKGRRAYDLARAGDQVKLDTRPVTIHDLKIVRYEYPELVLDIFCGSGTYIRSLGRDLAQSLGTGAVMSQLARTAIGDFTIESATELRDISAETLGDFLLPPSSAVRQLKSVSLTNDEAHRISNGVTIERQQHGFENETAAFDEAGELVAIVIPRSPDQLRPLSNLCSADKYAASKSG